MRDTAALEGTQFQFLARIRRLHEENWRTIATALRAALPMP